jgi:hypothetical protein
MTNLEAVNRLLRIEGIIRGDDDAATSFSDTAHANMIQMARIAIEDGLADLTADALIPHEEAEGYITTVSGTRTYNLAGDFIRFADEFPFFERVSAATSTGTALGERIELYRGGEEKLRREDPHYRDELGREDYWYEVNTTTNQVGFWRVPDGTRLYRYWYQKDVSVTEQGDNLPFTKTYTANAFCQMCSIRFRIMRLDPDVRKQLYPGGAERDPEYVAARARVFALIAKRKIARRYGRKYT